MTKAQNFFDTLVWSAMADEASYNADVTANEEGFEQYSEQWYATFAASYASLRESGLFTTEGEWKEN